MKRFFVITFFIALFITSAIYPQVREYEIDDFSGGLVTSLSNSAMKDNQAIDLVNYDIMGNISSPYFWLHRRHGMSLLYPDTGSGLNTDGLLPFYNNEESDLLIRRDHNVEYATDSLFVNAIEYCDPTIPACS